VTARRSKSNNSQQAGCSTEQSAYFIGVAQRRCNGMKRYLVEVNFGLVKIQKSSCDGGSDEFHGNRLGLASEV
jgi:hypothetical protein